jgi:hypothetical protein
MRKPRRVLRQRRHQRQGRRRRGDHDVLVQRTDRGPDHQAQARQVSNVRTRQAGSASGPPNRQSPFCMPKLNQGDADAQYDLGASYDNGQGVPQSDAEAAKWYRRAADQGFACRSGQRSLPSLLLVASGVDYDCTKVAWRMIALASAVVWRARVAHPLSNEGETTLLYFASVLDCRSCLLRARCCPNMPARRIPRRRGSGCGSHARSRRRPIPDPVRGRYCTRLGGS